MADHVGQQLGNYHLKRLLGQGGFANVYLGEHEYLKTQAAIKVLLARLASSEQDNFLNEARTIAALDHQHIVRVLEFGIEAQDNIPFLVTTYAPHGTLRDRHPKGSRLPLASILPYVRQAAAALQYAHEQKVIHRDIKPENMLLGRNDDILLGDFGIALIAQSTHSQSIQAMAGTMAYMAPEQLNGRPGYASDQYSLAIVIYEWLSGERPFQGTFTELASQHMFATPPPLHVKMPGISPDAERVIMTALSKDPQQRFGSIRAFANALEQVSYPDRFFFSSQPPTSFTSPARNESSSPMVSPTLADSMSRTTPNTFIPEALHSPPTHVPAPETPVPAPMTPIPGVLHTPILSRPAYPSHTVRDQPQARISRRAVVMGLGLSVVGLAGVGGYLYQHLRETSTATRPPSTLRATPAPQGTVFVTYHGHVLPVYAIAWSPDGKRIASASQDGTVHVWNAATGQRFFRYHGHRGSVNAVAWSPNGSYIASASSDTTVQVWDALQTGEGSASLYTYRGHSGNMRTLAWSTDNTRIASGGDDKTVQVWDAKDGSHHFSYVGHASQIWGVAWSPDNTRIASASVDRTAQVWSASQSQPNVTSQHALAIYKNHTDEVKSVAWSPDSMRVVSASNDRTVQAWDPTSGHHFLTYTGHTDVLNAVAWTPNDRRIVSGSGDYTVRIWDALSEKQLFVFTRHQLAVHSVAWSPDKQYVASASDDWSVQVWQAV
ncbi:MAG: protein kinase domain-containing protein [Ktedonobacteraceae bacterium]